MSVREGEELGEKAREIDREREHQSKRVMNYRKRGPAGPPLNAKYIHLASQVIVWLVE